MWLYNAPSPSAQTRETDNAVMMFGTRVRTLLFMRTLGLLTQAILILGFLEVHKDWESKTAGLASGDRKLKTVSFLYFFFARVTHNFQILKMK